MSNFMHKVKDAVTDRPEKHPGFNSSNSMGDTHEPYGSSKHRAMDPGSKKSSSSGMGSSGRDHPSDVSSGTYGSGPGSGNEPGTHHDSKLDDTRSTDGPTNAGPHDSKAANKVDPRIDSDLDNRGEYAGNNGSQEAGGGAPGYNSRNTGPIGEPRTDKHVTSEDSRSSSKQEHKSHTQPPTYGSENHMAEEENYSTSMQENKSHSATSHTAPCETDPNAAPGLDNRMGQQNFGGGAAAGSSSHNDNNSGTRQPSDSQNPAQVSKTDPRGQGPNYQQNEIGSQRVGY